MSETPGISPVCLPWRINEPVGYETACRTCETRVVVNTNQELLAVAGALEYDVRKQGFHGRVLKRPVTGSIVPCAPGQRKNARRNGTDSER